MLLLQGLVLTLLVAEGRRRCCSCCRAWFELLVAAGKEALLLLLQGLVLTLLVAEGEEACCSCCRAWL